MNILAGEAEPSCEYRTFLPAFGGWASPAELSVDAGVSGAEAFVSSALAENNICQLALKLEPEAAA